MSIGYWHAKRRISKGLTPLGYHRWLLNRHQRAAYDPNFQDPTVYRNNYRPNYGDGGEYGLHAMAPPIYDPNGLPPSYQPPMGGSKVDPYQAGPTRRPGEMSPEYEAPAGPPPPAAVRLGAQTTGETNPFRG